jgi:DNA repair protein RecO (recombination protein O)
MPLSVSWVLKSDLGTLTGAEVRGAPLSLTGDALLSGYYVNELLINFLHRHDPQPDLFETYAQTLFSLGPADNLAACLRQFELRLLRHTGYALSLGHEAGSQKPIESAGAYEYRVDEGPVTTNRDTGPMIFSGADLLAIGREEFDDDEVLRSANRLMRAVVAFHLGGKELKTRKVLLELHRRRQE